MKKTVGGYVLVGASLLSGPIWAQRGASAPPPAPTETGAGEVEASDPPPRSPYATRFELGGRTGYGLVFGKADSAAASPIKRISPGQIPLWLDLGARIGGHFFVGGYASYGFGILSDEISNACQGDQDASGLDVSCHVQVGRLGAEFLYHPVVGSDFDPWVGVSSGWEWFGLDETVTAGDQSASVGFGMNGPEYAMPQAGFDYWMSPKVTVGLFVGFSLSSYLSASASCDAADCSSFNTVSADIKHKALHDWLFIGGRMTFAP